MLPLLGPSNLGDGLARAPDLVLQSYIQGSAGKPPLASTAFLFDAVSMQAHCLRCRQIPRPAPSSQTVLAGIPPSANLTCAQSGDHRDP